MKIIRSLDKPACKKNDCNNVVTRFGEGSKKLTRKLKKSKSQTLFKFLKIAKSAKKQSKNRNLGKFNTIKVGLNFLTSDARSTFHYLWLVFIKYLIFWHFDPKYHI